jgi:hypothetical protein
VSIHPTRISLCIAALAGVLAGAGLAAEPGEGVIEARGLLSNGDEFSGEVLREQSGYLFFRDATGRSDRVLLANIVGVNVKLPDGAVQAAATQAGHFYLMGQYALQRDLPYLAAVAFVRTVRAEPKLYPTIVAAYKIRNTPLPRILDPEAEKAALYQMAPPSLVQENMKKARAWGQAMNQIAPATHLIETDHFLIYSAYNRSDDDALKLIYTRFYQTLCRQFDIPDREHLWIGKLPVYVFWSKDAFRTWAIEVAGASPELIRRGAGFAGMDGAFTFVALGPVGEDDTPRRDRRKLFYELLVHESTHAFLARYINHRYVVSWLNEGLAETLCHRLLPGGQASKKRKQCHVDIRRTENPPVEKLFVGEHIPMEPFYYGAAQSLTEYLIDLDRGKYIRLIRQIKAGQTDRDALKDIFGLTPETLVADWKKSIAHPE